MLGWRVICLVSGLYDRLGRYMLGPQRYMLTLLISKQKNSLKGQILPFKLFFLTHNIIASIYINDFTSYAAGQIAQRNKCHVRYFFLCDVAS